MPWLWQVYSWWSVLIKGSYGQVWHEARVDCSFHANKHPRHHTVPRTFFALPMDIVTTFPIVYVHLNLLGVKKRCLKFVFMVPEFEPHRLIPSSFGTLGGRKTSLYVHTPHAFWRHCRHADDANRCKVKGFRIFVAGGLYTSLFSLVVTHFNT